MIKQKFLITHSAIFCLNMEIYETKGLIVMKLYDSENLFLNDINNLEFM